MSAPLLGRAALITGASQGLGLAIAQAYVRAGASVFLCARDGARLKSVCAELAATTQGEQRVFGQCADVSRQDEVERLCAAALGVFPSLEILVNNAGVYGPLGVIEEVDWNEWVQAVSTNLFGSVMTCRALLPHFKRRHYGKIIQLSGGGATNPLPRISAYAASKAAVVRFAETLADEVRDNRIDVNAIAPGPLNTRLLDEVLEAGAERVGQSFYDRSVAQKEQGGAPLERGASLAVFLASAASDGITGKLLSAIWDPWHTLDRHVQDLRDSDVYTLRRIVPTDRKLSWGGA
ncbi:MAG: SDR family NAD(P)-dependent oxidoreductase [Vicinamibacterales bacterium]